MAEGDADESPTILRRQLGRLLREAREGRGLSIASAAKAVQLSFNALQRLETGRTMKPRKQDVRELCSVYEVSQEKTAQAVDLARRVAEAKDEDGITSLGKVISDSFYIYVDLERYAKHIVSYQEIVPGLLQTSDYARTLFGSFWDKQEDIDQRLRIRLDRQVIVTRRTSPIEFEALIHESALHQVVGGPRIMAQQLRHLADMSTHDNITVRIYPFSAGAPWGLAGKTFVKLDFGTNSKGDPVEPPIVFLDAAMSNDVYVENPDQVRRYDKYADAIRSKALNGLSMRDKLRDMAREYDRER
ncbi:helix-turn-helix domain-containing protein [Nocardia terpenica]|uniref:Helix-turn-helix domain-containing protein n=1 Tax=Nocardia terpenica TaxID=455432 RepID=A0A6G9YZR4_9NOCA|nr:helix-turn-helix transcriptional regulator [Nocardia terpenica]QIS18825.1 helix-turn-helix domain-containing protein [Nocardia terpenica]